MRRRLVVSQLDRRRSGPASRTNSSRLYLRGVADESADGQVDGLVQPDVQVGQAGRDREPRSPTGSHDDRDRLPHLRHTGREPGGGMARATVPNARAAGRGRHAPRRLPRIPAHPRPGERARLAVGERADHPAAHPQAHPAVRPRDAPPHHISTSYLHRLFREQGSTVGTWIRQQRLERTRRDLGDPALAGVPVNRIAARWGFPHHPVFTRAFHSAYGMPPRDYRHLALGGGRAAPAPSSALRGASLKNGVS